MKALIVLSLVFFTSCASTPTPQSCNEGWSMLDKSLNGTDVAWINKRLHPDTDVFRDRDCNSVSKEKGQASYDAIRFADKYRTDFDSWTSDQRSYEEDVKEEGLNGSRTKQNYQNLDNLPIPYPNDEVVEMIQDLKLKQVIFRELRKSFKSAGRELQYLAPIHYKRIKEWLSFETSEKDQKLITKFVSHLEKKTQVELSKDQRRQEQEISYKQFLAKAENDFGKVAEKFNLEVVRSDGVDSFGLNLGQTIFRLKNNKLFTIVYKKIEGDKFSITLENVSNKEPIIFKFSLNTYASLVSTETNKGTAFGSEAMMALMVAVN
jgi:hypothetical protein